MTNIDFNPTKTPAWRPDLPERMSATQITMLARCPEQYRQRYLLGKKAAPGAAMILGRADTKAIAAHLDAYMADGVGLTYSEVQERFVVEYDQAVDEEGGMGEIRWRNDGPVAASAALAMAGKDKDTGVKLVKEYRQTITPQYQDELVAVEREIELTDPTWAVPIIGYLDVETTPDIIERKTTGRRMSKLNPDWIIQGRIYQLGVEKPMWWHQSVKTKDPYCLGHDPELMSPIDNMMRDRTRQLVARSQRRLVLLYDEFGPDDTWDGALTHPWACGFCGFKDGCWWWGN